MSVLLVGFRASGKTTLGRELAKHWGWNFIDLDELFEERYGTILSFVEKHGEELFRQKEREVFLEGSAKLQETATVVATGGGLVQVALDLLTASPIPKIYLELPPQKLWERIENSPERRKIGNLQDYARMEKLWQERKPLYEKIATFQLENRDIRGSLMEIDQWRQTVPHLFPKSKVTLI